MIIAGTLGRHHVYLQNDAMEAAKKSTCVKIPLFFPDESNDESCSAVRQEFRCQEP